jgi:hypothetical protein
LRGIHAVHGLADPARKGTASRMVKRESSSCPRPLSRPRNLRVAHVRHPASEESVQALP